MEHDMPCIDGKAHNYKLVNGQYICQREGCGHVSLHRPGPNYDEVVAENIELKMRVAELERFVEDYAESINTKTDFQSWAIKLIRRSESQI